MKKLTVFLAFLIVAAVGLSGQSSLVVTYTDGDIPTDMQSPWVGPSSCPGVMTVTIPEGNWVTGIDVSYDMTASSWGNMHEQRSQLYCITTGMNEGQYFSGTGNGNGTIHYNRAGLDIANFASGEIVFHLSAGRTGAMTGCNTTYNKVDDNTWILTIHYEQMPPCPYPYNVHLADKTNSTAAMSWTQNGVVDSWDILYGTHGFDPLTDGELVQGIAHSTHFLEGLEAATAYDVYVRANCGDDGLSEWSQVFTFQTYANPLVGSYTVNRDLPTAGTNFNNFSDLAEALNDGGLLGHVVVDVAPGSGPYNEQVILHELPYSSEENTLTINGNGETLEFLSLNTDQKATLKLIGTSFVTFNQLAIKAMGQRYTWPAPIEYGYAVELLYNANNTRFFQCQMIVNTKDNHLDFMPFIASSHPVTGATPSNLIIEECVVVGGQYGISINGPLGGPYPTNNIIVGNEVRDFNLRGIHISNQHHAIISENTVTRLNRQNPGASVSMIVLESQVDGTEVTKNRIYGFASKLVNNGDGISSMSMRSSEDNPVLIANNHISGFKNINAMQTGISLSTVNGQGFVNIYHNTVLLDNIEYQGDGTIRCFYHNGHNAELNVKNNLFSYTSSSSGLKANMHFLRTNVDLNSNNNLLHRGSEDTNNKHSVIWGTSTNYTTLQHWQNTGNDQQSIDADPLMVTSGVSDLIPSNPAADGIGFDLLHIVPDDINGVARTATPDPGANEFEPAGCLRPSQLFVTSVGQTAAELGWTSNGSEESWNLEWGLIGFEPGNGTTIGQTTSNPHLLEGLQAVTGYEFYVQAVCQSKANSAWAGPYRFFTSCDWFHTPIFEDFDDETIAGLPLCWEAIVNSSSPQARVFKTNLSNPSSPDFHVQIGNSNDPDAELMLVTPDIDGGLQGVHVSFMARCAEFTLELEVGTVTNEGTFSLIQNIEVTTTYTQYMVDFDVYTGTDTRIAFRLGPGPLFRWAYLDDISIIRLAEYAGVEGIISNSDGEAVEGANVMIDDRSAVTDETGFYAFDNLLPGSYRLRAEAGGYAVEQTEVQLAESELLTKDVVFHYANPNLPFFLAEAGAIAYPPGIMQFRGAATDGVHIYQTLINNQLYVFDPSDIENIVEVSSIEVPGAGLVFHHEHLYVFSGSTVLVFDTSDPANLQLLSTFVAGGAPRDMQFDGQTAWLLVHDNGMTSRLLEMDISDPAALTTLATLWVNSGSLGSLYYTPQRNLVYIHGLDQHNPATISIVDVSAAGEPDIVYSASHGGAGNRMAVGVDHFFLAQNVGSQGQISAFSTADPVTPVLLAEQNLPDQAQVLEISNITGTLMLHTQHPGDGHRLISMVFDEEENQFYEGMGLSRRNFGMAAKYDFIEGGFATDEKQVGSLGGRHESQSNGFVDYFLLPRGQTFGTSFFPPETPIIRIGKPPAEEEDDEEEDCEAELSVSGYRGPVYFCPSEIEENARMNVGRVTLCACEESAWSLGGFNLVASGTGDDKADISLVEVLGPANAFGTYPVDNGVFPAVFYQPVTIAKGECVSFNVFYTFSFLPEFYAYDEIKSFKWQTAGVSAFQLDCEEGEIKGMARMDSLTFARVFRYREGMLQGVYARIQESIDDAATLDEDELKVCKGTYKEIVSINKILDISSFEGREETTIAFPFEKYSESEKSRSDFIY